MDRKWINLEVYRYGQILGWYLEEIVSYDITAIEDMNELISRVKEFIDPWDQYRLTLVIIDSYLPSAVRRSLASLAWLRLPFYFCFKRRFHSIFGTPIDQIPNQSLQELFDSSTRPSLGIFIPNKLH